MNQKYDYYPSYWVIVCSFQNNSLEKVYKILCGFYGGYLGGDEWRMSSGITEVIEEDKDHYLIKNESGSVYKCHKKNESLGSMTSVIFDRLKEEYKDDVKLVEMKEYLKSNEYKNTRL